MRTMTVTRPHSIGLLIWSLKIRKIFTYVIFLIVISIIFISINDEMSASLDRVPKNPDVNDFGGHQTAGSQRNVFFLKIHKTASSTIQNILMRYGDDNDLNFVLPYTTNNFGLPESFHPLMALPLSKPTDAYNIFCHHSRFNQPSIEAIMPEDTVFVTMLRDPVTLFESLYSYYDLASHYVMDMEELVKMPDWWFQTCDRYLGIFGMNQMAFDFGWQLESSVWDQPKIRSFIDSLDKRFDLVMIAEYFEESLVLLKHLLDLSDFDMVCFHHNKRKANTRQNLTQELAEDIRKANHLDHLIYDHFLNIFLAKVEGFGSDRMRSEVAQLKKLTNYWTNECGAKQVSNDQVDMQYRQYSSQVHSIQLKKSANRFCQNLAKAEIPFTRELRQKHLNRHANWWLQILYRIGYYRL